MTEPVRHWKTIGFELEGAWDISRDEVEDLAPCVVHGDASVTARSSVPGGYSGEVVAAKPYQRLSSAIDNMRVLWPPVMNESCGFHLHVGFAPGDYAALLDLDFYDYYIEQWAAWGHRVLRSGTPVSGGVVTRDEPEFWNRLEGRNRFCEKVFRPDNQLREKGKPATRYSQLNFCWARYKTVECRMLPMFRDKETAMLAVKHLLWIYDSWIDRVGEQSHSDSVPDDEPETHTFHEEADIKADGPAEEEEVMEDLNEVLMDFTGPAVIQYRDPAKTNAKIGRILKDKYPQF